MFSKIAKKFHVSYDQQEKIKKSTKEEIIELQDNLGLIINCANAMNQQYDPQFSDELISMLAEIDPMGNAEKRLKSKVNTSIEVAAIIAVLQGNPLLASQVMTSGYALSKAILGDDPEKEKSLDRNYNKLAKQLDQKDRLINLKNEADDSLDRIKAELKKI